MTAPYYKDDLVTLYHGDCLELADVWTVADVLVTDPPYGINVEQRQAYRGRGIPTIRKSSAVAGDKTTEVRDSALLLWGDKPRVVFGSWRSPRPDPVGHRLIWHKKGQNPGPAKAAFISQDEEIYITGEGFLKSSPPQRSVIETTEARSGTSGLAALTGHPTPKPIALMEILIERCPAGVVADPFSGSGSTLIAARNLGRKSIGVEIDEGYCEQIVKRLSQQAFDFGETA